MFATTPTLMRPVPSVSFPTSYCVWTSEHGRLLSTSCVQTPLLLELTLSQLLPLPNISFHHCLSPPPFSLDMEEDYCSLSLSVAWGPAAGLVMVMALNDVVMGCKYHYIFNIPPTAHTFKTLLPLPLSPFIFPFLSSSPYGQG